MSALLVTLSDVSWSLQNNLTGILGLDWTVNLLFSLLKRIGNQHALRDFASSEFVSAKYAGNWGLRRGGLLSPRGRVWTFQHVVWTTPFDFTELKVAHVFVPDEHDPTKVPRITLYGTVLLAEPLGTLAGKKVDIPQDQENLPFLLRGAAILPDGLRGWTRFGGRAEGVYPGSLVPHFPAGGLHFDSGGSSLTDLSGADRHGGQLTADVPAGSTTFDFVTSSSGFQGRVNRGDPFVVEGDTQVYVTTKNVLPVGPQVSNVEFTPPSARKWSKGVEVDFRNAFATPAPQDARLTELEPGGTLSHGKIERQALMVISTGLGVADGDLFYLVDPAGTGQKAAVVRAGATPAAVRVRLRGDDVPSLGRVSVKVYGIAATPGGEATPALTRADASKLGVPTPSPPYAAGDALQLIDGALPKALFVRVTKLVTELEVDAALPGLASSGSVALLDLIPAEAERRAKLTDGGKTIDFKVDPASPVGALPAVDTVLGVIGKAPGAVRIAAIVKKKIDDHQVGLDRAVGTAGDDVTVRTLTKKSDLGTDPVASGTKLTYHPTKVATAPAAAAFILVDAGEKAARAVTRVTFDGLLIDQSVPAAAAAPTATRFPARKSKLDATSQSVSPIWILTGAPVGNNARALALRGFTPMPPPAGAPIALPAGATLTAGTVKVAAAGAALPALPPVGDVVRATVGATSVLALVRQIQLEVTLDRALPAEASAAGLELVPLEPSGPEYQATARDVRLVTVRPELSALAGVQVEMPRFLVREIVLVTDATAAPPVTRSYRVAAVDGTTLTLEMGAADLTGPFPKAVTVRRLGAKDPQTGSTRSGLAGTIPGADRKKLTFDVWTPSGITGGGHVAVVDGARVFPAVVDTLGELRIALATDGALADGAVALDTPARAFVAWTAAVNQDGNDIVMDDVVVATAAASHDVAVVPYVATARVVPGRLTPGTTKVPDRLDDAYDLNRFESVVEHELHHSVQSAEMGPLLLSFLPMWAVELVGEAVSDAERAKFKDDWAKYQSVVEAMSVGGVLELLVGSVYGGLLWLILLAVHGINSLTADDGKGSLDFLDPFALTYFPATVPDPAKKDTIAVQPLGGETLTVAAGDRLQLKKPSESRPITFFSNRRTVKEVHGDGTITLDSADLPLEGNATAVAKVPGAQDDPLHTADNALLRGLGLGWMSVLFDPYGELAFRTAPEHGSFADFVSRVARYAFGTRSWGLVMFTGIAFWDNLRRQWGFLSAHNPHLARMEKGASYFSGDTYYPLGLLRASGAAAVGLQHKQLVVGDVAQSWFLPSGAYRREYTVLGEGKLAAPGVPVRHNLCQMPFLKLPAAPNPAFPINLGAETDPAVLQSGLALPDTFIAKDPANFIEPDPALPSRRFLPGARGSIPVTAEMERSAGMYVAFCQPSIRGPATTHRFTVEDTVDGGADAHEAFEVRGIDLVHDLTVLDVTLRIGGRKVADGAELGLLPFERARVEVSPNGARQYDATVMRPTDGDIRRVAGDLSLQAAKTAAAEPVEVSRIYRFVDGKGFDGGGLATWGLHVPSDVHIPVRRFKAKVDPVLPVRTEADPDNLAAGPLKPGQKAHLLVPVRVRPSRAAKPNPTVAVKFTAPAAPGIPEPLLGVDLGAVDPSTDAKLKSMFAFGGRVLTIALPVDEPPEQDIQVDVSVDVGPDDANTATCTATFTVQPHFTLARVPAGPDFKVAPGATITLECSGGVQAGAVKVKPLQGITVTPTGGNVELKVAAGTPNGPVRVLVDDKSDPTHKALRTITVG